MVRGQAKRQKFFEEHTFESGNALRIEGTSLSDSVSDDNQGTLSLQSKCGRNRIEKPVYGNKSGDGISTKGTTVDDTVLTDAGSVRRRSPQRETVLALGNRNNEGSSTGGQIDNQTSQIRQTLIDAAPMKRSQKIKSVFALGTIDGEESSSAAQTVPCEIANSLRRGQAFYQKERQDVSQYHDVGDDEYMCVYCDANFWLGEANKRDSKKAPIIYPECCKKGRVKLEQLKPMPVFLNRYMDPNNGRESALFRNNIRVYNSMFAYTSMGAKIDYTLNNGSAPYVFKICGQVHHLMGSMLPEFDESPRYAQLYIYDTQNEVLNRINAADPSHATKVKHDVVSGLIQMFDEFSDLTKTYRAIRDRFQSDSLHSLNMTILAPQSSGNRQYERPSSDEIGGLIVGDIGEFNSNRDIVVQSNDGRLRRISKIHPKYMSLQYPILFPYGEDGYHINLKLESIPGEKEEEEKNKMSMRSFVVYHLHDRNGTMNTVLKGGRLFQQYLVDSYATVDENRLDYIRANQDKIRTVRCDQLYNDVSSGVERSSDVGQQIILPSTHTGSPRDMLNNYHDAMAICRQYGNPDLFITFTCNPKWIEIVRYFDRHPGYKQEDRPDIVSRIFNVKLKDMIDYVKSGKPFGQTRGYVCTVEFQKRGLPHAHMLFWLTKKYKCYTSNDIDSIISAELPDVNINPILFNIVSQSMIHGPCGLANSKSPCMKDGRCTKNFPKPYNSHTIFEGITAPTYKRRDDQSKFVSKDGINIGNEFVVPYNAELLLRYNAHINVELCSQSMLIKYLFKYVSKGPDRARILIHGEKTDEIKNYLNCRYLTPHESVWRLFEYSIHSRYPAVQYLTVHLPNEQNVTFRETETIDNIIGYRGSLRTTLTGWFVANRQYDEAKQLTYPEFPTKFVWHQKEREWTLRKRRETIGRMAYVSPIRGEAYFLRMLLNVQKGCCSYKDIKTVNDITYPTYRETCQVLGLLGDDKEWIDALTTSSFVATGPQMRQLFATIVLFCQVADPQKLFELFWLNMSEDILHNIRRELNNPRLIVPDPELKNKMLFELEKIFNMASSSLLNFRLPMPDSNDVLHFDNRLMREELDYDCNFLRDQHANFVNQLNHDQKNVYDYVITAVNQKKPAAIFVHGSGGTGKTFLWHTIISKLRSEGKIVLAVASSGIASLLLPNGRTAHSRFKIPLDMDSLKNCFITKGTNLAKLLKKTELIIWDEAPMSDKRCFELLDECLRDILKEPDQPNNDMPFCGKTILLGGDFRQILPVVPGKGKEEIIQSSINCSYLWKSFKIFHLMDNMRLMKRGLSEEEKEDISSFANWILKIGEGRLESVLYTDDPDTSWIEIPQDLLVDYSTNPIEAIFLATYPNFSTHYKNKDYLRERAIVTPRNVNVNEINDYIVDLLPGDTKTYLSSDTISYDSGSSENIDLLYPMEFLNQLEFSGLPTHQLILKVGMPIMLLRNLNQMCGLCNGTRLIITKLFNRLIEAEILTGNNIGHKVFIPRIISTNNENKWPFTFKRRQFPVKPCYAMTINKSQGQSLNQVGVYLPEPVFTHGQLYVAVSRVTSKRRLKILINNTDDVPNKYTKNIVFKDVFQKL